MAFLQKYFFVFISILSLIVGLLVFIGLLYFYPSVSLFKSDILTPEERVWLNAHDGKIRLAPDPFWEPMEFFGKDDEYSGIIADFMKLLEKKLEFKFKLVHARNWQEVIEMAKNREVDILGAANSTPERKKYMLWTQPYLDIPTVIVTRKSVAGDLTLSQLKGKSIGVHGYYVVVDFLETHYPELNLVKLENNLDGIRKVSFGELDALVVDFPYASYTIAKEGITNLKVAGEVDYRAIQSIGIRNDWPVFFRIVQKGLAQITQEERKAILGKWTYLEDYPFYYSKKFWLLLISISGVVLCVAVLTVIWNITLRFKVKTKTNELTRELTRKKEMAENLEESRQRLANLISNLPGMAYLSHHQKPKNDQWPDEYISDGCYELTGHRSLKGDGLGQKDFFHERVFHPDERIAMKKSLRMALSQKKRFQFVYRIITATGETKWVWEQGLATHTEYGEVAFVEGFVTDISELKNAEMSLSQSKKLFQDLVNNSPIGISIIQNQHVVFKNPEQEKIFGVLPTGYTFLEFDKIFPNDMEKAKTFFEAVLHGDTDIESPDLRLNRRIENSTMKEEIWVHCIAKQIDYKGEKAILLIMIDITRAKQLEGIVSIKDKMASLGHVAAGIAHEIRNPLSGINIYVSGLGRLCAKFDLPEQIQKNLYLIKEASNDIELVVRRVLDFAKPGIPLVATIDARDPVNKALYLCKVFFRKSNIRVEKKFAQKSLLCRVDDKLIQQVVLNILTNAAEAMAGLTSDKIICVRIYPEDDFIIITVSDSGPGVAENEKKNIFDPFYTTKKDGTGIGLSLCHKIIEDHFGVIKIMKSSLGGAKFVIKLPIQKEIKT